MECSVLSVVLRVVHTPAEDVSKQRRRERAGARDAFRTASPHHPTKSMDLQSWNRRHLVQIWSNRWTYPEYPRVWQGESEVGSVPFSPIVRVGGSNGKGEVG